MRINQFWLFGVMVSVIIAGPVYSRLALANDNLIQLVAAADPWPPYIDETHPSGGVSIEVADAAFRTQGYTVRNEVMPWARALEEVKHARVDLILDAWWSQERSELFIYSRPYMNGPIKFIKRKGDPFEFDDLSSLQGKSIGLVRNYAYGDEFLKARTYDKVLVTHFMQAVQMLALNRIELTIENELVARRRILRDAPELLNQIEFVKQPLSDNYIYVIASYNHPRHVEMISAFNKGLKIILENGIYQKIMDKNYLSVPDMFLKRPE